MNAIRPDLFDPATLAVFATLAVLSFLGVTVAIFKAIQFARLGVGKGRAAEAMLDTWLDGNTDAALEMAAGRKSVLARILHPVFVTLHAKPDDTDRAEELGRQRAIHELATMSDRLRMLEIVVQAAPMLGLLGTVIGMIDAFSVLALSEGAVDPASLAGGIWTALTTTAVGLAIALVAFFIANWFESRIERERNLIETLVSAALYGRADPSAPGG